MRAAVAAQRETGAALMIHPGRHERLPLEIVSFINNLPLSPAMLSSEEWLVSASHTAGGAAKANRLDHAGLDGHL